MGNFLDHAVAPLALIVGLWASAADAVPASETRVEVVTPGPGYGAGWFRRLLLGEQWRDLWTTPVEVPVLDLQGFDGGLRPQRRGGGLQTRNLRLKSGNGHAWVFRSVDKDVSGLLDPDTRASIFGDILQDLTSTIHPGAALVVPPFLDATGVVHAHPQLAVMPDDPELGEFRAMFVGMLGLLEERDEGSEVGVDKLKDTLSVFVRLETRSKDEVDSRNYLRARLIDVLVGDWDRHLDQWRWARFDQDGRTVWRPIPRDRDQAFSRFGGIIPSVAEYYTKQLAGFGESYPPMDKLTFSGRFTDRRFLVWLDRGTWESETADLVGKITDEVISNAVRQLPSAMYAKGGAELERLLRARRDGLVAASRDYYRLLASEVDLRAAEGETIRVRRQPQGSVEVSTPRFRRVFVSEETSELRVYTPRGGRVVDEGSDGGIRVRIVPPDPREPEPVRARYEPVRDWGRDLLFFPVFSYDSTRGLFPGVRAELTSYGFELHPYASRMDFAAAWATAVSRPRLQYTTEFRTRSPLSVLVSLWYSGVEVLNFYGFGNDTQRIDAEQSAGHYDVRQEHLAAFPALQLNVTGPLRAYAGFPIKHVSAIQNSGSVAGSEYGSAGMTQGSGEVGLLLDTRTGALTSQRGFRFRLAGRHTPAIFSNPHAFSKLHASASASVGGRLITDVFLDLHLAAEKNWGTYPFFDAAFLGGAALPVPLALTGMGGIPLLGFDANRYAGDAAVGGNAELRIAIGRFLALLPFRYGISGVADVGRVFRAHIPSSTWHNGAGGGLWLAVFAAGPGLVLATSVNAMIVRSDERTAFYVSTGFGL
ncbi:MAG: hypothetical protein AUH83_07875 [Deltaproteobacteria bacterium 13_1_40CM_4_68_19]|nr:MAG: hypothetical protein AUH83_07875 [Deltaproteobacteria bacterium 13_1_40CM_4_68_19]